MRFFTRRRDSEATQQEADAWLDTMRPRNHPYQQLPNRPDVRGGQPIGIEAELDYLDGQDDQ